MNRILDIGYPLWLGNNDEPFIIKNILGKGASSVTYLAVCGKIEHVLKECNPLGLYMHRNDDGTLVPDTELNRKEFEECLVRFVEGVEKQLSFRMTETLKNSTSNVQKIYRANGTAYIDMTYFKGCTYDQVEFESLFDVLRRMKALTKIIAGYHEEGYLHLDIKPQNIYAIPETPEMVMMFDFDSVVPEDDVGKMAFLSYTDSWAAPEQKMAKYRKSISKATDLFAIGEIIFHCVMGRHSILDERFSFSKYSYDKNAKIFKNVNPRVFRLLDDLFHKTLCCAPASRVQTAKELIGLLDEIIPLANPKEPYLITTLPTAKEFFIGRDAEIEDIHARLQKSPVLFLHGIGGIGKSELAKQYAKKYQSEYDTVIFAPFVTDVVSMLADDRYVHINNFCYVNDEKIDEYYERKLRQIKKIIKDNEKCILLIVDNFDTAEDTKLTDLLSLGCKVLITSRVDFSDVYAQKDLEPISNPIAIFNEYYNKPLSDAEMDMVNEIISIVSGHTMTVELLAKQMMASRITPEQMLTKLKSRGVSDSGKEKVRSGKDGTLIMQSTFDHIQTLFDMSGLEESEKYILSNLSLIPHTGISIALFCEWCEIDSFDTINRLSIEGWIRCDGEKDYISLHPVVGNVVLRFVINNSSVIEDMLNKINDYYNDDFFKLDNQEYLKTCGLLKDISLVLLANDIQTEAVSCFLNYIPMIFSQVGYWNIACNCVLKSCDIAISINGDCTTARINLSQLYRENERWDEAEKYLLDSLKFMKKHHNYQNNAEIAISMRQLGEIYCEHSNFCNYTYKRKLLLFKAKRCLYTALYLFQVDKENQESQILECYNALGIFYDIKKKRKKAVKFYFKALDILNKVDDYDLQTIGAIYCNIGSSYTFYDSSKAIEYFNNALDLFKSKYGDNSIDIAKAYFRRGVCYHELKNYEKAEKDYLKSKDVFEKIYIDEHPHILKVCTNLLILYNDCNNVPKEHEYQRIVENMYKKLN